jgi:hypothetical protein
VLALKLFLVPTFLLLISLAGRRWGPAVAGWLAGLPVLTGPILFLLALEHGAGFVAAAATVSLSAVFGAVVFILTYARVCARRSPGLSLLSGLASWCCTALLLTLVPPDIFVSLGIALFALLIAPSLFPRISAPILTAALPKWELPLRMLAGAAVTLAVTTLAAAIGPSWSGMFAVFPVITIVLSVFSHRTSGPAFAATLLRAMIWGLYSLASFCLALAVLLPQQSVAASFLAAVAIALAVQWALKSRLHRR